MTDTDSHEITIQRAGRNSRLFRYACECGWRSRLLLEDEETGVGS